MILKASFAIVVLACASCGGSTLGGAGGSGGSGSGGSETGGTTGVAGTSAGGVGGTSAGGTATEASLPRCLADLVAPCTCQWTGGQCGAQTCFLAGVTSSTTNPDGGACNDRHEPAETRVLKPDGTLCYSVRRSFVPEFACESGTLSWWDASGQMVASMALSGGDGETGSCASGPSKILCSATGDTGFAPNPWPNHDCPANACQ